MKIHHWKRVAQTLAVALVLLLAGIVGHHIWPKEVPVRMLTSEEATMLTPHEKKVVEQVKDRIEYRKTIPPKAWPEEPPKIEILSDWSEMISGEGGVYSGLRQFYRKITVDGKPAIECSNGSISLTPESAPK